MKCGFKKYLCLWVCVLTVLCGCGNNIQKYESTGVGMGTVISWTIYTEGDGTEVLEELWERLEETEAEIAWRRENSEVSGMNLSAGNPDGYVLLENLQAEFAKIWQISRDSGGALDVTIAPVVRLWDIDTWAVAEESEISEAGNFLPTESEIAEKLSLTGYEKVKIEGNRIFLPEGCRLDFGAVGKGMACDRILTFLEESQKTEESVEAAVCSLGGNILTYGKKPDGTPWKVGITDPFQTDHYLGVLTLTGTNFVTTSGDYERYVEVDGVRYHHIIDPHTGYPAASGLRSVTILSEDGLTGDALSTACFVLGQEKALKLAGQYGVEILMVTNEGEIIMSEGMKKIFQVL